MQRCFPVNAVYNANNARNQAAGNPPIQNLGATNSAMIRALKIVAACLATLAGWQGGHATDLPREQGIAEETTARAGAGEAIWLETAGVKFQAFYREAISRETRGGLILLHGLDASADAADILQSMRKRLPERGWDTLALQGPMREAGADLQDHLALLPEAVARIQAGIDYLKSKNHDRIVLIGHGTGALTVLRYLARTPDTITTAAIIIDSPASSAAERDAAGLADLGKVNIPLLDILSRRDEMATEEAAPTRKRIMKKNEAYRQTTINDPEADFKDVEDLLINRIHGWLVRVSPAARNPR
jgi:pimeloyl-ACP methyl ester carboxylesterase